MATSREYFVDDADLGRRRAYTGPYVAELAGVTPKTITVWLGPTGNPPAPLRGWAPHSDANPSGRWLVDADMADAAFARESQTSASLADERARLNDERAVFEMERAVFERNRLEELETENAKLKATVEALRKQVATLGGVVRELSETAVL